MDDRQSVNSSDEQIDCWAYVEIFGHHQIAGRLTSRKFGTQIMFQIDVPKDDGLSHSELYSPNSIFSIKPTTEEWCRRFMKMRSKMSYDILPYIPPERQLGGPGPEEESEESPD